ncbi:glycosyltransferase family 4 protein [Candidatus Syntrophocurvum alkaliphilum]|nr:glycosyltransferase family 4 protein [Candidatus Syntrophocurvum alkaliphilum]
MAIVNLGTYPPKQCGIATFSNDLRNSLTIHDNDVKVIAISDNSYSYQYSEEVIFEINQNQKKDYINAAHMVNRSDDIELVILQHEYGIFGGKSGQYILEFTKLLRKPYVLVTHTVLPKPERHRKQVLKQISRKASGIVCMTEQSKELLVNLYGATPEVISVIGHGVPEFKGGSQAELKEKYNLTGKQVISTFGLIGPGKGLELGIKAVKKVTQQYPDVLFLILGQTHPMLKKTEGEKYREMLEDLVEKLDLKDNVRFVNKYLTDDEIGEYLYATDIYLSPYPNKDQAVSGTLAFAVGCGRAIVATAYSYAKEVLSDNRGLMDEKIDPDNLARLMVQILSDEELKETLQNNALALGKEWTWPSIGMKYTDMFHQIINGGNRQEGYRYNYAEL